MIRWYVRPDGNAGKDSFVHLIGGMYMLFGTDKTYGAHELFDSEMEARRTAEAYLLKRIDEATATLAIHRRRMAFLEKLDG